MLARRHPFRNFKPLKVVDALLNQQEHLIGWHNCSHRKEREERKENPSGNLCALRVLCGKKFFAVSLLIRAYAGM